MARLGNYCGYLFDHDLLGKYGCANCHGEGLKINVDFYLGGHPDDPNYDNTVEDL